MKILHYIDISASDKNICTNKYIKSIAQAYKIYLVTLLMIECAILFVYLFPSLSLYICMPHTSETHMQAHQNLNSTLLRIFAVLY